MNIRLDTKDEAGKNLIKTIVVNTNAPAAPQVRLMVAVAVEPFATIRPKLVKLAGAEGAPIAQTVEIHPAEKYAFKVLEVSAKKGEHIGYALTEKRINGLPVYNLTVENRKTGKGRFFDTIVLKTDHPQRPVIEIGVFGVIS